MLTKFIRRVKFNKSIILTNRMKEAIVLALIAIVITLFCLPILENFLNISHNPNFCQSASFAYFTRSAIIEHCQFPLRCPYFGGGYPLISNPHDLSLSPFFIFVFIFGEVTAFKILIVLVYYICAFSMYYLTRYILQFGRIASLFSSLTLSLSWYASQLAEVRIPKIYFYFLPLLLIFLIKGRTQRRFIIYGAFLFTIILADAGLSFISICLFLFIFLLFFPPRDEVINIGNLKPLIIALAVAILLGAVKILPMIELLRQNSRSVEYSSLISESFDLKTFLQCLTDKMIFSSDAIYMGYAVLLFSGFAFVFDFKKLKGLLFTFMIIMAISFGPHSILNISFFLWQLPLFRSMSHLIKYYSFFLVFILSLAIGYSINMIQQKIPFRMIRAILFLIFFLNTADIFGNNIKYHIDIFDTPVQAIKQKEGDFAQAEIINARSAGDKAFVQYLLLKQNIGVINFFGNIDLKESAIPKYFISIANSEFSGKENPHYLEKMTLNPVYRGELFFVNHDNNLARYKKFSPNSIEIEAKISNPDILVINQNFDHSWRMNQGQLFSWNGLLAVKITAPGEYNLKLVYVPLSFFVGAAITVIAIIGCVFILRLS